ncbi:hypothetical protein PLICRDRAFT_177770 [Plicaturopsis crispa FD-325 SS-3]|nr:hypothetical protein PLICRDRAFT_177770 [Plicaturopsis crispa FD-325 SS-3]
MVHHMKLLSQAGDEAPCQYWVQRDHSDDTAQQFERPLDEADWTRFHLYACRVRTLDFDDRSRDQYINCFYGSALSDLHASAPTLLPNLQALALGDDSELVPYIGMLLPPKLTSFSVVFQSISDLSKRLSLLTSVTVACPALTSLTVHNKCYRDEDSELLVAAVSTVVGAWSGLTHLDVPGLTPPAIGVISALPSLRSIKLRMESLEPADTQHMPLFPSLRSIELRAPSLSACISFLSLLPLKHPLHTVKIMTGAPPTPELYRSFMEAVAEHCSPLTLRVVDFLLYFNALPKSAVNMMEILSPLLPFNRLERLCAPVPAAVTFDDAAVRAIGASWPRLRIFNILSGFRNTPGACGISASVFADLVTACPSLCALSIPVDMAGAADARIKITRDGNTNLRTLSVGYSTFPDVAETAAFLADVCPNLDLLNAYGDKKSWGEVARLVTTRRRERAEI